MLRGQAAAASSIDTHADAVRSVLMDPLMQEVGALAVAEPFSLFMECTIEYNATIASR